MQVQHTGPHRGGEEPSPMMQLGQRESCPMLFPLAGGVGTVVKFGEFIAILELHRQGLKVARASMSSSPAIPTNVKRT